jgi:dTDP-N-acetylfucosamine:lipid II N-acetylfucosaminyltransferase
MNLHVGKLNKFIPSFMGFYELRLPELYRDDCFFFTGDREKYSVNDLSLKHFPKGLLNSIIFYVLFSIKAYQADKIILHGLFEKKVLYALFLQPWLLKKCAWMIWGNDLYVYRKNRGNKKKRKLERIRRFVIKRFGFLVTYVKGDVALAREWYGATGKHVHCILYTSNVFEERDLQREDSSTINVQVGNSADPSNAHESVLEGLSRIHSDVDFHVYAPLSYGNQKHADCIEQKGKDLLGKRFTAMRNFMPIEEYYSFLANIDVAIFNHDRQQGMGNIINLLGLRKKVFMRSDVTSWTILKELGLHVYDVASLDLTTFNSAELNENYRIITKNFSKDALAEQLNVLLGTNNK